MPAKKVRLIIRMGSHAEKDYLEKTIRFLDGVIIGANLLEAAPGATASSMVKFGGEKLLTPLYIDPMTYAFGLYVDPTTGRNRTDLEWIKSDQKKQGKMIRAFKRSYKALATKLGPPFEDALARGRAVSPKDFVDQSKTTKTCESVINYQLTRISSEFAKDPEFEEYSQHVPKPAAVFAPYFYIVPQSSKEWTDTNLRLARTTAALDSSVSVHVVICADVSFLMDRNFLDDLRRDLPRTGAKAVWLWFSKFYEDSATSNQLKSYRSLIEDLSKNLEVYSMHGGYLSLAFCNFGLTGVSHGVGYGEQKDFVPVIGQSTPTVRY